MQVSRDSWPGSYGATTVMQDLSENGDGILAGKKYSLMVICLSPTGSSHLDHGQLALLCGQSQLLKQSAAFSQWQAVIGSMVGNDFPATESLFQNVISHWIDGLLPFDHGQQLFLDDHLPFPDGRLPCPTELPKVVRAY